MVAFVVGLVVALSSGGDETQVVQRYVSDLRSVTQGRGNFSMEFDHYEQVPAHIAEKVIEEARKRREEAHA